MAIVWRLALLAAACAAVLAVGVYRYDWRPFGPKRMLDDAEKVKMLIDQKMSPYAQTPASPTPVAAATPAPTPVVAASPTPKPAPTPKAAPTPKPKPKPKPTPTPKPKPKPTPPLDQQGLDDFLKKQGQ